MTADPANAPQEAAAPKESVPQTNAGERKREREPEVRKCRWCGYDDFLFLIPVTGGGLQCRGLIDCRDRCVAQLKEKDAEIIELQQLLRTSMSLLPDSDVAKARNAKVVVLTSEVAALRELMGEYREELRLAVSNCHCDRVGRECCCSMCRANMSQIDQIDALLATKPGSAHKEAPETKPTALREWLRMTGQEE